MPWINAKVWVDDNGVVVANPPDPIEDVASESGDFISLAEAARRIGRTPPLVQRLARDGFIRSARKAGRVVYSAMDIDVIATAQAVDDLARSRRRSDKTIRLRETRP
jgi:hypothetical protein